MGDNMNAEQTSLPIWMKYKIGDKIEDGRKILNITFRNSDLCILIVDDPLTKITLKPFINTEVYNPKNRAEIIKITNKLLSDINSWVPEDLKTIKKKQLGSLMAEALLGNVSGDIPSHFSELTKVIENYHFETCRKTYLLTSIISIIILTLILFFIDYNSLNFTSYLILSGFFGGAGAFLSILIRFENIKIGEYESRSFLILRSFSRILIGLFFGLVSFFLIESKFIIININPKYLLICILSFVSGFSERLIPELITKIEKSVTKQKVTE